MPEPTLLDKLHALRSKKVDEWSALIDAREADRAKFEERSTSLDNKPTDAEIEEFRAAEAKFKAASDLAEAEIGELDERVRQHTDIAERRAAAAAEHRTDVRVTSSPMTYRQDNQREVGYFRDLAAMYHRSAGTYLDASAATERLQRHAQEVDAEMPKRAADRERKAKARVESAEMDFRRSVGMNRRGMDESPFERRVNPNRTDGQGGYFVPPLWLIDEYIPGLRAGRVAAGLCRQMDLPPGTDSINIPKLSTLTQVGVQGADGGAVTSQDFTDTSVQANVKTLAGQEDVAIQLLEQSPGMIIDQVVMQDLMADYNRLVDRQVITGNGANSAALNGGQIQGIYPQGNWSGTNTVTWTTGSPLVTGFNMVLGAMASKVAYNRFDLSNFNYLLHPRRWFWMATGLDGANGASGRPIVNNSDFGPFNVSQLEVDEVPFEGLAGRVPFGPKVYIDANVPVTDNGSGGATGTDDIAIGAKWDDLWLFEGELRTRVLPEVLSGTLEVRFQVYNYVAFLVRYGQSIAIAEGTGFAAPASAIDSSVTF